MIDLATAPLQKDSEHKPGNGTGSVLPFHGGSSSKIEELKSALPSIHDTVLGLKSKGGGEMAGPCPKCGGEDRFFVRADGSFACRQCGGKGGDAIDFHTWLNDTDAKGLMSQYLGNRPKPEKTPKKSKTPATDENLVKVYTYEDEAGADLFHILRYEKPGHDKTFRQGYRDEAGQLVFKLEGVRRVLYRLPEVIKTDAVILVEGEKDVDSLLDLGITATTSPMGASNWKPEYAEYLRGKHVAIIPDNDESGRKYEQAVLASLVGVAESVRVVRLPGKGKDVTDWLEAGGTRYQLSDLIEKTEAVTAEMVAEIEAKQTPDILTPVNIRLILSTMPERMPFLIADRIPAGRGILITGLGGSSKTRILYQLAIGSIIGHLPFPWEVERTGRAVLVLTEDTESDVHRTLFFMVEALGLTEQEKQLVADNLIVFPMAGKDIKLLAKGQNGVLERTPAFYDMVSRVNDLGNTVFVGIDPALGVTEGDELDQNHQRTLGKTVDDMAIMTGATCALVSHATKASLGTQELSSHNSRGGGAITDAVRAEYSMRNMTGMEALKAGITDPEERRRYVQLCATKGNALPPSAFVPVWLKRDDSGTLFESELVYGDIETPREKDMKILELLETPSNLKDWREKTIAKGLITAKNADGQKKDMDRVKQRLEKAGLIKSGIGKGVWLRTHETETDVENYRDID